MRPAPRPLFTACVSLALYARTRARSVEGGELEVLKGFDWHRHSISVLLIEIWASSRKTYAQFLQSHGLTKLDSFNSPTNLNEVWYNRSSIAPRPVL